MHPAHFLVQTLSIEQGLNVGLDCLGRQSKTVPKLRMQLFEDDSGGATGATAGASPIFGLFNRMIEPDIDVITLLAGSHQLDFVSAFQDTFVEQESHRQGFQINWSTHQGQPHLPINS